ncbi:glycerophosphodiester phosphodiesterase [Microbispora sp. RL4-1S]|uniref:Glycerophosphodiester phosphodiesterase n=1 Tax=Microbispora oryzae TaxID=2806554 RepID=A0A940WR27_9ACTN|nr:glycerophosphodiester phosphodiesterase family protein [Microbispora oryzae]MBP2705531.1 glycerophosphodiester phosphodiesterase [Microbispora oryzae]
MLRPLVLTVSGALAAQIPALPAHAARPAAAESSQVVVVAHRGASAYAPENTIAAFEEARRLRADTFELDVQQTRDHQLVLMHDVTLARTTDVEKLFPRRAPWRVGDFTLAEIRRLDAGSWFAPRYKGERVPTLGETLTKLSGSGLDLLLEIKEPRRHPGIEGRIARELRAEPAWLRPGRLTVQSFDWDSARAFHRLLPNVPIGLLGAPSAGRLAGLSRFADEVNPPYASVTAQYVRRVHANHMRVLAWTVNDAATMRRLISAGVDGIITNRPDLLRGITLTARKRPA